MKIVFSVLFIAALFSPSIGQIKKTGNAKSGGPCSPAVTGDNNTIHFTYCGSDPEETKKVLVLLKAINQGQDVTNAKLDEVLEILLKPIKITIKESGVVAAPPSGHPRFAISFYTDDPVDRGQFEVFCDRNCIPVDICRLIGSNASKLATVSDHPDIAEFLFQRQFPALTPCTLTVESRDESPVKIVDIKTSTRITGLVLTANQPRSSMVTDKSVMF
jgi:hypothetical protein